MNNEMPMGPMMPGMHGMPNMAGGNMAYVPAMMDHMGMGGHNCQCKEEVRALNNRIDRLEREVKRLERKVEGGMQQMPSPMPYGNVGNSNMNKDYPPYQSGNYMI